MNSHIIIVKIINTSSDDEQKINKIKNKILVRAIADYIAGMTDSYAINEYHILYQ